jgi:hypothetical protein
MSGSTDPKTSALTYENPILSDSRRPSYRRQRRDGGGTSKPKEQAHAQVTHAPEREMRGPFEANGKTVPQRSDEQR